jgi:hypothetical protein
MVRLFGSWAQSLLEAGVDPAKLREPKKRGLGPSDALRSLRAAGLALGKPFSVREYDDWVRAQDATLADRAGPGGRPAPASQALIRMFGSWPQALAQAYGEGVQRSWGAGARDYSDEDLIADYRACLEQLGHPPGELEYNCWRYTHRRTEDGAFRAAWSHTLARRIGGGSWSGVALAAGVELPRSRRSRREFHDDDLAPAWHDCAASCGHPPSEAEYDAWREAELAENETRYVPSSSTLRRRLGHSTWSGVAATLGVELDRPPLLRNAGVEELTSNWQACASELGHPPSIGEYNCWRARVFVRDPCARVAHHKTLAKQLGEGSWPAVASRVDVAYSPKFGPTGNNYSDEELAAALESCVAEHGHPPSPAEYTSWRRRRLAAGATQLPSDRTLVNRLGRGSWRIALGADCTSSAACRISYGLDQLVNAWRSCALDLGRPPSQYDYDAWRREQLARDNVTQLPHYKTLADRLGGGSWPEIVRRRAMRGEYDGAA